MVILSLVVLLSLKEPLSLVYLYQKDLHSQQSIKLK
jgi:hypothetical protein